MSGDAYVPTAAGLAAVGMTAAAEFATLDDDLRNLIGAMRAEADAPSGCDVDPDKLRAIADDLEQLRPIDSVQRARFLGARLRHYGLHDPRQRR